MKANKEGYHLRTLRYYGDGGVVNEIHGFVKLIAIHGGGNYGLAEQYDIINSEGRYKLQYYADSSAKLTKYEPFNTNREMNQCKCTAPTIATKVSENGIYSYCTKCAEEVETFNTKEK